MPHHNVVDNDDDDDDDDEDAADVATRLTRLNLVPQMQRAFRSANDIESNRQSNMT